jgi:serine/threonine protein kinase
LDAGGDLREYIKKHPDADRLGLVRVLPVTFDPPLIPAASYVMLPKAFTFLHSRNIVHGDLKGVRDCFKPLFTTVLTRVQSNILLDAANHARITDFGLTTVTQNLDSIRSASDDQGHIGQWTAPEILNEEGHTAKKPIFSLSRWSWSRHVTNEFICIKLWLTAISHHRSYLPARFHSVAVAYLQRLCWR